MQVGPIQMGHQLSVDNPAGSHSPSMLEGKADLDGIWVFGLKGMAFLYNQVRHIVAIFFLISSELEHPS